MKKTTMMRIASTLLIAVLLTTCVLGATFAKYVTTKTSGDQTRVAYWGWEDTSMNFENLFVKAYDIDADDPTVTSVVDVVAPGTANEVEFSFAYNNNTADSVTAPEVDYSFVVNFAATGNYAALDANPNFYWTLDGNQYQTVALLKAAVEALDGDEDFEAGELPAGFEVGSKHTIGWAWVFEAEQNDEVEGDEVKAQDVTDTTMGNADELDDVAFTITITATQIN